MRVVFIKLMLGLLAVLLATFLALLWIVDHELRDTPPIQIRLPWRKGGKHEQI